MKKFIFLFISFFLTISVNGQSGDGKTVSTAYYGTISDSQIWTYAYNSGIIYVGQAGNEDLTIGNGGSLTIDPGVTVIFCTTSSDLIITGTGTLSADGTPASKITFTRYAASNNYWGHISFQTMGNADSSIFDNCVIEFGDVRTAPGANVPNKLGGGMHIAFSKVRVSYCTVRTNKAIFGGGIFVNQNYSPIIKNSYIYNNESSSAGGGFYFWNGSASRVENCIFDSNRCLEPVQSDYTGGGLAAQSGCSIKVTNCTFVNNTSTQTSGQSVMLSGSTADLMQNCIVWGNTGNHFYLTGSPVVNYCAVEGSAPSGTGNFVLSSANDNAAGPNFLALDGSNWSIKFISPCRDAGTTPSPAITNDYAGKSRIGTYDIGAYEVQYSRWAGSTSDAWSTASNWVAGVVPVSGTSDIIVPAGLPRYPVNSSNPDFTIGSGKQMIIEQGARVTLGDLTNNGIVKLNHNSSGFASLIISNYTRGTGATEEIQLYLTGGGNEFLEDFKWHYISSPVSSLSTVIFTGTGGSITKDLAQFVESRPALSTLEGWVAYDGWVYSTGIINGPTFNSLTPGKGYSFFDGVNNSFTFGGSFNTSDVVMSVPYSGVPSLHGFNMLGNPFSSGLNWNDITNSVYFPYPSNTSKGVYFTRNNIQCTYINGLGIPGDVTPIIPPMQGFFTKTYATGNSITLAADARTHSNIHDRYKSESIIPLVRLELRKNSISSDETVVRFDTQAKPELDYDFDAEKMFLSQTKTQVYTVSGGIKFAINGQPFPASVLEIPIVANITKDTIHTISATQLQGLDGYGVFLRDYTTGLNTDLKSTPVVTFTAAPGTITNRFVLSFTVTGTQNPEKLSDKVFNIYYAQGLINIQTLNDSWDGKSGSVRIMDITGKTVTDMKKTEFALNSPLQVPASSVKGIYLVEIRAGMMRFVGKVVVR